MKRIFKYLAVIFAVAVSMTSCREDYDIPSTGAPDHAETLVAGTYVGTFTRVNTNTEEIVTEAGSITFSPIEGSPNVCSMTVESTLDLAVAENTSVCNISKNSGGVFNYWNSTSNNPFGFTFTGKIYESNNEATISYTQIKRANHKEVKFNYTFSGIRQ